MPAAMPTRKRIARVKILITSFTQTFCKAVICKVVN
jgi:hypothetical protein